MSKGHKYVIFQHLEEQAEIKVRERYWKKLFGTAQINPLNSINKITVNSLELKQNSLRLAL